MTDYILFITDLDRERFRLFQTQNQRDIIKKLFNAQQRIWACDESELDTIQRMNKNDRIFFAEKDCNWSCCGYISRTLHDDNIAVTLWGDWPRTRRMNAVMIFSCVVKINIQFEDLCDAVNLKPSDMPTGIHHTTHEHILEKATTMLNQNNGPPDKPTHTTETFDRNKRMVSEIKRKYHNRCQVCSHTININPQSRYSEVHHLHPLGEGGDDSFDNMLVLCPNHHVEFDHTVIGITSDMAIIDTTGKQQGYLTIEKGHTLNPKNIQYHLKRMKTR